MQNAIHPGNMGLRKKSIYSSLYSKRNTIKEIVSGFLILLFVYSAISKLMVIEAMKITLSTYPLIGNVSILFVYGLPAIELLIAALLFIPNTRLAGLYASFALMVSFTLYLAYMFVTTPTLPCTCGGLLAKMTWTQHFVFNICISILALIAAIIEKSRLRLMKSL